MNLEAVSEHYNFEKFDDCRAKSWEILYALAGKIQPGMTEAEGHEAYKKLCVQFGVEKNWHPSKIRFGANSIMGFREVSDPEVVLKDNDIFFLDIGPIIHGHEGDVGKTFVLGTNSEFSRISKDSEEIWEIVGDHWRKNKVNGLDLYEFARLQAENRGWKLNLAGASGHRIGDFPHHVFHRGSLREFDAVAIPDRWILEIQLRHPENKFGAFFEDVLR
jgi:methionyl aminopeptidase